MLLGTGSRTRFYKKVVNSKTVGFKTFKTKRDAEIAHYQQTELSSIDAAPLVYGGITRLPSETTGKSLGRYGFFTEIADLLCCPGNDCDCCDRDIDMMSESQNRLYEDLYDKLDSISYAFTDNHLGNLGYVIRDSETVMVVIDTGDEGLRSEDPNCPCNCMQCVKRKRKHHPRIEYA